MSENEHDSDAINDDCYDTYYDDKDPFQDDNNNNYTTSVTSNDPEQFEYIINTIKEVQTRFEPLVFSNAYIHTSSSSAICSICFKSETNFQSLICNHAFCHDCWSQYIDNNPQMILCPGTGERVFQAIDKPKPSKVACELCNLKFCFQCQLSYHAPASCDIMRNWLNKCRDDSETVIYISANTKDCPKCKVCIEKNGDWKTHENNYYECSKYRRQPQSQIETKQNRAREALKKYLHYFERWDNHQRSLKLEEQTRAKLLEKIEQNINAQNETYIDWQCLEKAADSLAKVSFLRIYT
ncbi:unnamed protein product [Rotaria sp. Silwood2]|nr:unnamed protein product [Rotaria sp. Silwood2]CAF3055287.1 unnamed protein product [Rotaria sp. Silwood2]CAF4053084.1 unnamed protein product [Rotaria sp. Silwood2]CAF4641323.1 unnamed protein product [Rotaria sp. Silwood2]